MFRAPVLAIGFLNLPSPFQAKMTMLCNFINVPVANGYEEENKEKKKKKKKKKKMSQYELCDRVELNAFCSFRF
jgi:hypothetical protein